MAKTAFDQSPDDEHRLGKFRRGPAEFSVVFTATPPSTPSVYRVDCDDGVGPREVCRFGDDPAEPAIWRGAWNGDEWCDWIMAQARELVARPSHYDY
jgi:hypothetical protein